MSPGLAWGPAAVLVQRPCGLRYAIRAERIGREVARLNEARATTARQLRDILAKVTRAAGPDVANLFEAQLLMLDDQLLVPRARHIIAAERVNAEWALDRAFGEFSDVFVRAGDAYLRERHGDVADVVGRLRHNLKSAGREGHLFVDLEAPAVLVADEIPPSLAGQIDRALVLGLAIDTGSHTHHSAILARSMGLPAVAALRHASALVRPGDMVLVDGIVGEIIIDPTQAQLDEARERQSDATRISV
ncbi:MAG: PEP-utilizing enzyme, partial [Acidobacteria bacterium]|nr:PEP-utilizing enzyme [Acidobacteriota bacterium]